MKVRFLRNTSVAGVSYAEGQTADVDDEQARQVIAIRKAVRVGGEEAAGPKVMTSESAKPKAKK